MQIKTTHHKDGSFTFESNGISKTFKGNLNYAKMYFRQYVINLLK